MDNPKMDNPIKGSKANWGYITIVAVVAVAAGALILSYAGIGF